MIFYVKEYKRFIPKEKELNYLLDAEMYLNHRFWDNMVEDIKINKDKNYILVKFWRDGIVAEDKIEKIKNKLYVYYNYTGYGRNYSPALIENVEKFDVMEKGNLFYIKLKVKNQEERIYCYEKRKGFVSIEVMLVSLICSMIVTILMDNSFQRRKELDRSFKITGHNIDKNNSEEQFLKYMLKEKILNKDTFQELKFSLNNMKAEYSKKRGF